MMKSILLSLVLGSMFFTGCATKLEKSEVHAEYKTSFNQIWNQVTSDELEELPQNNISFFKLFSHGKDQILADGVRTLDSREDILEYFDKLAHPNGICFKGTWEITSQNIYSGYFKKGSKALIIARASTAMSGTKRGRKRAFGFAGKLFPTTNPAQQNKEPSANFFLIDDLGGTDASHYTDVVLTNEPTVSFTFEVLKNILYALKVAYSFSLADDHPGIRQVYEIAQLGESENVITPKWMKIDANENKKVDKKDFRDELQIKEGEEIIFNISVASELKEGKKDWQKIGIIRLDSSVISTSCDHRLHFPHPKWKNDLKYR